MNKSWIESKTVWGAILVLIGGFYKLFTGDVTNAMAIIGMGLGLIGIRSAIK